MRCLVDRERQRLLESYRETLESGRWNPFGARERPGSLQSRGDGASGWGAVVLEVLKAARLLGIADRATFALLVAIVVD